MIYEDIFEYIDRNMSDSNIGGRKNRNIRDHLFILYGVINSVIHGKEECIDIQIYDIKKAFDALWLDECYNDLYDILPPSDGNNKISLLHRASQENNVAVNTPAGLSDRINMPCIIQQGGVWGSILCANIINTIGRKCWISGKHIYLYKSVQECFL